MSPFLAALWAEGLKARRSRVPPLTAAAIGIAPLMGGLFMVILKDPERARSMGLLSQKAQLIGEADWPSFFGLIGQAMAVGGGIVFAFAAAWLFAREFADRTAKELLALPTPRGSIVAAKFAVLAIWTAGLTALVLALGFAVGGAVGLPGWSPAVAWRGAAAIAAAGGLTLAVTTPVALLASVGRSYLAGLGWAILMIVFAQVLSAMGWGGYFPWAVPALLAGVAGDPAEQVGPHSYVVIAFVSAVGVAGTLAWWRRADHTR